MHTDRVTSRRASAWLAFGFGVLVTANASVAAATARATSGELALALVAMSVSVALALSLRRGARWAWWIAAALSVTGLFFVLPLAGTVLFGSSAEPVGTGWDLTFFPLLAADLLALLIALWTWRRGDPGTRSMA